MAHAFKLFHWFSVLVRQCTRATGSVRQVALDEMIPSPKTQVFVEYDGRDDRKVGVRGNLRQNHLTGLRDNITRYALTAILKLWRGRRHDAAWENGYHVGLQQANVKNRMDLRGQWRLETTGRFPH